MIGGAEMYKKMLVDKFLQMIKGYILIIQIYFFSYMNKVNLTEYYIKKSKGLECPLNFFICRKWRFGSQKHTNNEHIIKLGKNKYCGF